MNLQDAIRKIEELEARIRLLEAAQPIQYHYHYYPQPLPIQPVHPTWPMYPIITCGGGTDVQVYGVAQ